MQLKLLLLNLIQKHLIIKITKSEGGEDDEKELTTEGKWQWYNKKNKTFCKI